MAVKVKSAIWLERTKRYYPGGTVLTEDQITPSEIESLGEYLITEDRDLSAHTVAELKSMLEEAGIEYEKGAKKADLIALLED